MRGLEHIKDFVKTNPKSLYKTSWTLALLFAGVDFYQSTCEELVGVFGGIWNFTLMDQHFNNEVYFAFARLLSGGHSLYRGFQNKK